MAVARSLGIPPPPTIVSNRVGSARAFTSSRSVVTKPLSPGVGIAPFTSLIEPSNLDLVENNPSLLQECITASADLHVVVTGCGVWVWRRPRDAALDWRAVDPGGQGFSLVDDPPQALAGQAVALTAALGLTSSVQDWLETDTHPVFLEVNPQGNWLFLSGATEVLAPAFARLVSGDPPLSHGTWPGPWRRLANDFRSAAKAPPSDGIDAPVWLPPVHLRSLAEWDGSIEVARRAYDAAVHAVAVAEAKASRLVQTSLALIALGVALISLQIGSAETLAGQALALIPLAAVPSTPDPAKPSAGAHPPKPSPSFYAAINKAVLRPPLEPGQYLSIRYSERLADNGIVASVGSKGDSYDNSIAESFNGLYKWELIYPRSPWKGLADVEWATLEYVDWFNNRRLHGEITNGPGYTTPDAFEADRYRQHVPTDEAGTQTTESL